MTFIIKYSKIKITKIPKDKLSKSVIQFTFLILFFLISNSKLYSQTELWFGNYCDDNGKVLQGRYNIEKKSGIVSAIQLAPYGISPIDFKIIEHDTIQGLIKMEWPGNSKKTCTLIQYHKFYYSGNWIEGAQVRPIIIKKFNGQDAEMQGNWFKPNEIEIKIIDYAMKLLSSKNNWNRNGNRICESIDSFSIFCALYKASIEVDGEYRHLRPSVREVREVIKSRHPKRYEHVLVDFNNANETTLKEVQEVLKITKERLIKSIKDK